MYLSDFLEKKSGKEGNHWMKYHIILGYVQDYKEKHGIKILLIVDDEKI
ncbi:MAG: hypothetical protein KGI08_06920 [Thaumarchaeota archaeon]|nr:hypothetical protein [Nitrososphaerota archaeon]